MSRGRERTHGECVFLRCASCSWSTYRTYDEDRDGFGRCNKCGGELRRHASRLEERRAAIAKRDLQVFR